MNTKELAAALEGMDVVDLTLTMEEGMPVWPTPAFLSQYCRIDRNGRSRYPLCRYHG